MSRILSFGSLALLIPATTPALSAQTDEVAAVRRVVEAVAVYSQASNLAAIDTLFAPGRGVHIIEGAGVNHGWEDYRDRHLGPELATLGNLSYRYFAIEPQVRGTVAWAAFRYELGADTPNGRIETEGRGSVVLEQRQGRWVIVHLHTSGRRKQPAGGGGGR